MSTGSFVRRRLGGTIRIGRGVNGDEGADVHELPEGLRIRANINVTGGATLGTASVRIYGLTLPLMNALSTLGLGPLHTRNNTLLLTAGDAGGQLAQVFEGTIQEASHDFGNAPETCLVLEAYAGMDDKLRPAAATSYRGGVDVAVVLADLAKRAGMTFSNAGVSVVLTDPNYPGTLRDQIDAACEAAHIDYDVSNNELSIRPKGASRGGAVALVSAQTGMVGYPTVGGSNYLRVTCLFNPALRMASPVRIDSQLPQACGTWTIFQLNHSLESETPGGAWFTSFECSPPNEAAPVR